MSSSLSDLYISSTSSWLNNNKNLTPLKLYNEINKAIENIIENTFAGDELHNARKLFFNNNNSLNLYDNSSNNNNNNNSSEYNDNSSQLSNKINNNSKAIRGYIDGCFDIMHSGKY